MGAVEFPPAFTHCHASVSEMNISLAYTATGLDWGTGFMKETPMGEEGGPLSNRVWAAQATRST